MAGKASHPARRYAAAIAAVLAATVARLWLDQALHGDLPFATVRSTDLVSVIGDVLEAVRPAADAKRITLTAALDPALGTVAGDPVRLQQVVANLLSNAVKFTPGGGRAEIRLERSASEIRIVVRDTGQGIRPDFLPHVFEPFRQAEAVSRRREGGLGLGLAIVHRVVELHGGRVEARSEGEGRGTEMIVTLPFSPAAAANRAG